MNALGALLFADCRGFINDVRRVRRSPGRIGLWVVYAFALGFFFWTRMYGRANLGPGAAQADVTRADLFMGGLLVMLAFVLATGRGALGIFRTRAEARFIIGSPAPASLAIAYLQVRESLAQGARWLLSFLYFIFIFGPRHLRGVVVFADVVLVLAVVTAAAAIGIPRRLLPRPAGIACAFAGGLLALFAVAPALRDVLARSPFAQPVPFVHGFLALVPAWHPGYLLLAPGSVSMLAVLALATTAVAVLASTGRDAYPELYALSVARIDRLARRRRRAPSGAVAGRPTIPAPPGVLIFVWKSVVEFGRQWHRAVAAGAALCWSAAGFAAARWSAAGDAASFAPLFGVIVNLMLVIGITATSSLSAEVRRPLFWLAPAALFERLCALALARIWRTFGTFELIALGFALGGGRIIEILAFAVGLPALAALLAAVGFASFALFPSAADARGPVALLRLTISLVLLVPPFAVMGFATAFGFALAGLGAAVFVALVEAGGLIGIAAWRLDGQIDRLPV